MRIENDVDLVRAVHRNTTVQDAVVAHLDSGALHALEGADGILATLAIEAVRVNPHLGAAMRPHGVTAAVPQEEEPEEVKVKKGPLPKDFPGLAALHASAINTYNQLAKYSDDYTVIAGIGPATAAAITEALAQ